VTFNNPSWRLFLPAYDNRGLGTHCRFVAAHESGRDNSQTIYTERVIKLAELIRSMSPFQPLFLSPISRSLRTIDTLLPELDEYIHGLK